MPPLMKAPTATKKPHLIEAHGQQRIDNYFWLRDRQDPEVIGYLEDENRYAKHRMRGTAKLRRQLYREMRGRIQEKDVDVPVRIDNYEYYSRTLRGKQYPIHCRRLVKGKSTEETILDENALAGGHDFFDLGDYLLSPDHGLVAYTSDTKGSERYVLRIKDLLSGKTRRETIRDVGSFAWANDNKTLFYVTPRLGASSLQTLPASTWCTCQGRQADLS